MVEPTHLKNMLVKLDHETPGKGENKKCLSCHQLELVVSKDIPSSYHRKGDEETFRVTADQTKVPSQSNVGPEKCYFP